MLPSEQTVDAFKASGDLQDSQRAAPLLLQRLGGHLAKNNRPEAKTGTLVQDEIRASCGVVYRVRTGSIVGFVTDQTYFGDIVVDPKTAKAKKAAKAAKRAAKTGDGTGPGPGGSGAGAGAGAGAGEGGSGASGAAAAGAGSSKLSTKEKEAQRSDVAKLHARMAKSVLVWMYVSADNSICQAVSLQYTADIDPGQAFSMSTTLLNILGDLYLMGVRITLVAGDNATVNRVRLD